MVLESRVTADWAMSLPEIDAPVRRLIIVLHRMIPSRCAVVPISTLPATCQKMFLGNAPPVRTRG